MHIVQLANIAVQLPSTHLPHTEVANITSFTAFQATDDFTSTGNLPSFQQLMSNHEEMFRIALCAQQSTPIYDIVQLANIAVQLPSTHLPHTEVANITSFTAFQATVDFTSTGNLPSFQQLMSNHEEMFRIALCAQQSTPIYDIVQLANIAVQLPSTHLPHTEVANITSFTAFQATVNFTSTGNLPSFQQLMFNREGRLRMNGGSNQHLLRFVILQDAIKRKELINNYRAKHHLHKFK
jgi:hypothetical protein